jgi:hypothetical protein
MNMNILFCRRQQNNFGIENTITERDWQKSGFSKHFRLTWVVNRVTTCILLTGWQPIVSLPDMDHMFQKSICSICRLFSTRTRKAMKIIYPQYKSVSWGNVDAFLEHVVHIRILDYVNITSPSGWFNGISVISPCILVCFFVVVFF